MVDLWKISALQVAFRHIRVVVSRRDSGSLCTIDAHQTPPRSSLASNTTTSQSPFLYSSLSNTHLSAQSPAGPAPIMTILFFLLVLVGPSAMASRVGAGWRSPGVRMVSSLEA